MNYTLPNDKLVMMFSQNYVKLITYIVSSKFNNIRLYDG